MRALKMLKSRFDCILVIGFAITLWVALIGLILGKF